MKNTIYVCEKCGEEFQKWQGRCTTCSNWNTLKELKLESIAIRNYNRDFQESVTIDQIESSSDIKRTTGIGELDTVFGGGVVNGEVVLFAGNPGIGKSTLMLQLASKMQNTLYISCEESLEQIKSRWIRLKLRNTTSKFISTPNIFEALEAIKQNKPSLVILDSIQAVSDPNHPSTAGNPIQLKVCSLKLQEVAKKQGIPIVITSHVTKSGIVAGPKTLEHLVDAVFYLEGDKESNIRILRSVKNRYGTVDEIGIFSMTEKGLKEIENLENIFLDKEILDEPGVITSAILEGNRPLIVEIQVLAVKSYLAYPKRVASGIDINKINLLIAVLEGTTNHKLYKFDLYFNLVGGLKTKDNSLNLSLILAMISAVWKKPIARKTIAIGEVGLTGEVRATKMIDKQIKQAEKLGFEKIIVPSGYGTKNAIEVKNIKQAILKVFKKQQKAC